MKKLLLYIFIIILISGCSNAVQDNKYSESSTIKEFISDDIDSKNNKSDYDKQINENNEAIDAEEFELSIEADRTTEVNPPFFHEYNDLTKEIIVDGQKHTLDLIKPHDVYDYPNIEDDNLEYYDYLESIFDETLKKVEEDGIDIDDLTEVERDSYYYFIIWYSIYDVTPLSGWYNCGVINDTNASSYLEENGYDYSSKNIHDFDISTPWVEGSDDYGIGEYVELISPTQNMSWGITIYNGYCKNIDLFYKNSRVKELLVYVDGLPTCIFELEDTWHAQEFGYKPVPDNDKINDIVIRFEILSVYEGSEYNDTCISDIFMSGGHWVYIEE